MSDEPVLTNDKPLLDAALNFERAAELLFLDKTLLQRALTHRSYINESRAFLQSDNERLEFLGDAVLDFVIGEYLYHRFPELREGPLTNLRAALVREETLAHFASELDLGAYLFLGRGEAESGGRERPAILCAGFEALVGALYLDQGMAAVKALLFPLVEPVLPALAQKAAYKDAKSRLQEWSQSEFRATPRYDTVAEHGPDHAKRFTVEVIIDGLVWGVGRGKSKQKASQAAAAAALRRMAEQPPAHIDVGPIEHAGPMDEEPLPGETLGEGAVNSNENHGQTT